MEQSPYLRLIGTDLTCRSKNCPRSDSREHRNGYIYDKNQLSKFIDILNLFGAIVQIPIYHAPEETSMIPSLLVTLFKQKDRPNSED
jgi:hypothetical protein